MKKQNNPNNFDSTENENTENSVHNHENNKDHYHGNKHYDKEGNVDTIKIEEFNVKNQFCYSKKNLTFKIAASGVLLALSIAVSALDIILETVLKFPVSADAWVSFRFLDIIVLLLGIPVLGPIFGSLIAFLEPIFHNLIHGMEHGWIQPFGDALSNILIVWLTWVFFYVVFKNSPYHRDPNKKKDWFKRIMPSLIMVIISALLATAVIILILYLTSLNHVHHDHEEHSEFLINYSNINIQHGHHHHHDGQLEWNILIKRFFPIICAIFGVNILRYLIAYSFFVVVEGKMRVLNHRYR